MSLVKQPTTIHSSCVSENGHSDTSFPCLVYLRNISMHSVTAFRNHDTKVSATKAETAAIRGDGVAGDL